MARELAGKQLNVLDGDECSLRLNINIRLYRARDNSRPIVGKLWRHLTAGIDCRLEKARNHLFLLNNLISPPQLKLDKTTNFN